MDVVESKEVDKESKRMLLELLYSMGPPPIDVVIIGAESTKLETDDVYVLHVSLPIDPYRVLREVAVAHALTDPQLLETWSAPPELKLDELAYELSVAMLMRIADFLVARVQPALVAEKNSPEVVEGETLAYTVVRTLAVDVSISLALAGHMGLALQILNKYSTHPAYDVYRRFWEFALSNFKFLSLYNWLLFSLV
ncbi:MAG: hypothetical protein ABWK05_07430 [Pyrobaculum sp.]